MHKPLYYLSLFLIVLTSCATNNQLITVERPPDLILSNDIVRIALIDRSKPSNATLTVVEGVFTGEYIGADRQGRKEVLRSFTGVMDLQDRFEIVTTDVEWEGTKSGATLPKPLPVDKIKALVEEHEVDAVLALESFDSDGHSIATDYLALGAWYLGVFDPVDYPSNIRTGWRLYDAIDGAILDEFQTFTAADGWWTDASVMPYDQLDIIAEGSRIAAYQYAGRIVPMPVRYDRMYYRKAPGANDKMKAADRLVRAERWEKAEALWKQVYDRAQGNKAKARSAYNLAIVAERNGDLDGALKWLDEAITYGNDPAIAYAALITERKEFQMWHELNQFKEKEGEKE